MILNLLFSLCLSANASSFTDADLNSLLQKSSKGDSSLIIYTWSPHMNWSVRGIDEIEAWAQAKKMSVRLLLDPKADLAKAKEIQSSHKWDNSVLTINESAKLIKMGMRTHYPSYIFIKKGEVSSPVIPGYKSAKELESLEKRYLR